MTGDRIAQEKYLSLRRPGLDRERKSRHNEDMTRRLAGGHGGRHGGLAGMSTAMGQVGEDEACIEKFWYLTLGGERVSEAS